MIQIGINIAVKGAGEADVQINALLTENGAFLLTENDNILVT
jgi:hypothetical protein